MKFYTNVSRFGNNILLRGYENGVGVNRKEKFAPTFFTPSKEETGYKAFIDNHDISPRTFESMSEAKEFINTYKDTHGFSIYGNTNYIAQYIQENYPGIIEYDMSLMKILIFDIEVDISNGYPNVDEADKEVTSISMKFYNSDDYYLLGRKDFDKYKMTTPIDPEKVHFRKFDSEVELLKEFLRVWMYNYPDIITGFNVNFFDVSYIVTRIMRVLGEQSAKMLSPWRNLKRKTKEIYNRVHSTYDILGISVIDFMEIFKKFGYKYGTQESYKLDHIAHVVLGEKKIDYSEYGNLTNLYNRNPQLYLDYNLKDTYLVQKMEEKTGLISLVLTVAYKGGVNFEDTLGTVAIWESILYRKLMDSYQVPPIKKPTDKELGNLVGGYVKDPQVGKHSWVVSFDLNSLYPHLMMQYNMSPETFIGKTEDISIDRVLEGKYQNHNPDISVCANGATFSNKKLGVVPSIIEGYYAERKSVKDHMLELEGEIEELKKQLEEFNE